MSCMSCMSDVCAPCREKHPILLISSILTFFRCTASFISQSLHHSLKLPGWVQAFDLAPHLILNPASEPDHSEHCNWSMVVIEWRDRIYILAGYGHGDWSMQCMIIRLHNSDGFIISSTRLFLKSLQWRIV